MILFCHFYSDCLDLQYDFVFLGRHYYYNVTENLPCEKFEPFFLLVKDGNIIGLGWQFFGKTTPVDKNWYDNINEIAVKATVPIRPKCLVELTNKYGVISTHMYFVQNPWFIGCNPFADSANIFSILGFWMLIGWKIVIFVNCDFSMNKHYYEN